MSRQYCNYLSCVLVVPAGWCPAALCSICTRRRTGYFPWWLVQCDQAIVGWQRHTELLCTVARIPTERLCSIVSVNLCVYFVLWSNLIEPQWYISVCWYYWLKCLITTFHGSMQKKSVFMYICLLPNISIGIGTKRLVSVGPYLWIKCTFVFWKWQLRQSVMPSSHDVQGFIKSMIFYSLLWHPDCHYQCYLYICSSHYMPINMKVVPIYTGLLCFTTTVWIWKWQRDKPLLKCAHFLFILENKMKIAITTHWDRFWYLFEFGWWLCWLISCLCLIKSVEYCFH